ncbi:hypothetical protein D3C87_184430 [compost metagenome]
MKNLINRRVLVVLLALFSTVSVYGKVKDVPYTLAKNYFIKNTYPDKDFHFIRITSQEKFDEIFGMATLMGDSGKPTAIDFAKNFVIALINGASNNVSELKINTLTSQNEKDLTIVYSLIAMPNPQSFTARHTSLLIVDKSYNGRISANRASADGRPLMGGDVDEFGCKPSTGYTWSVLKKKCIRISEEKGKLLSGSIGNLGVIFGNQQKEAELIGFSYTNYPKNLLLKYVPKTKVWKHGNISLALEKGNYVLRDKKVVLAKSEK